VPTTGQLQDKIAIVTGAARGQGAAEAARFAEEGAQVIATDVLDADGVVYHDVASAESWQALVADTVARYGRVDVLVNNAGIHARAEVHEMDESAFRSVLDVNLIGPFLGIKYVVQAGTAAYTASKFGLRGLTRAAALDLGPKGIRVNAILPGVIRTPMVSYVVETREDELAAGLPLRRIGEPDDIADAAVFLASENSRWITGTDVTVDGGLMAGTPRLV
jgi:3alpha(or 20beta)-hydroxysteroid dehydrogenase